MQLLHNLAGGQMILELNMKYDSETMWHYERKWECISVKYYIIVRNWYNRLLWQ